jgi:hypothetical protein
VKAIKTVIKHITAMGSNTYSILKGGLLVANAMLLSALIILIFLGNITDGQRFHELYNYSQSLRELTFAVCFETVFGSALIEQYVKKSVNTK